MTTKPSVINKPPHMWSTVPSSNGILKNLNIHPAVYNQPRISKRENIIKLVTAATKNIPGASKIIDQHFSEKAYAVSTTVSKNRPSWKHVHGHPF